VIEEFAPRHDKRAERALWWSLGIGVALALVLGAVRIQANPFLGLCAILLIVVAGQRYLLAWPTLLGYLLITILFIPIRRYSIGGGLPIQLEPYRVLVFGVLLVWLAALLVDDNVRWRKTNLEPPLVLLLIAIFGSLALNVGDIANQGLSGAVVKKMSFFASYYLVLFFVVSVIRTRKDLDRILMVFVAGGIIVAITSIIEWRTHFNPYNHIQRVIPIFHMDAGAGNDLSRGASVRTYASAEHPIALGAALVLLLPLAIYIYRRRGHVFWLAGAGLLTMGALATGSRTAALMLVAELVVFVCVRPRETVRLLPMLLPLMIVLQVAMPGTLTTFKSILQPQAAIKEQQFNQGAGAGRLADLGPSLQEWARNPFFGAGFGTRLPSTSDKVTNARILDDEWLGQLLEIGAVGVLALLWLLIRTVRMCSRRSRNDRSSYGWMLSAFAASVTAFGVGMFTYDAFSFAQVTFMAWVILGLAAAALRIGQEEGSGLADGPGSEPYQRPATTLG
jgi:hypothetical protein